MKIFIGLVLSLNTLYFCAFATDTFYLKPVDENLDLKAVPEEIKIDSKPRPTYLRPQERDKILEKHFSSRIKNLDQVDRDLLYKSILYYPQERLMEKYPFIKPSEYKRIKNDFE